MSIYWVRRFIFSAAIFMIAGPLSARAECPSPGPGVDINAVARCRQQEWANARRGEGSWVEGQRSAPQTDGAKGDAPPAESTSAQNSDLPAAQDTSAGGNTAGGGSTAAPGSAKQASDMKSAGEAPSSPECMQAAKAAQMTCATMTMMGLNPTQAMMMEMMLSQAATLASSMSQSGGVADTCKKQADLGDIIQKITMLKTVACGGSMAMCLTQCSTPKNPTQAQLATQAGDKANLQKCQSYQMNVAMMVMQSMSAAANVAQNKSCVKAASGSAYSGLPATSADCSNPEIAKVSPQCICQADPKNPICPGAAGAGGATGGMAGPTSGKADLGSGLYANDGDVDPGARTDEKSGAVQASKGSNTIEGGGAGGPGGGFGGGSGGGGEGGGVPAKGSDKSAISGLAGGGGSGLGGAGGGGGSSGSRSVRGTLSSLLEKLNLKKLLPSGKDYKARGLAGMSIKSADGITGPMGPSLFEKVSTQYQRQKTNLIQEK